MTSRARASSLAASRAARCAVAVSVLAPVLTVGALGAGPGAADAVARASVPTAAAQTAARKADARITSKLRSRIKAGALGSDTAVRVYDPLTKRTVYSTQSTEGQLPASNMKLITAVNALTVIGPATRFPTRVVYGASPTSVVLVGGGDPLLSSTNLRTLASRTVAGLAAASPTGSKPTHVTLSVDATLFPAPTRATGWTSSYGLGEISPVRALARHGVASSNTTNDAASYFVSRLRALGVSVTYKGAVKKHATGVEVARVAGHRVDEDVRAMMPESINQIAETLYRQTALYSGHAATWGGASNAARAALKRANVPVAHLVLRDGSGLSRSDRVTAAALVAVVRLATDGLHPRLAALVPSLPVAGRTGTLRTRFSTTASRCARGKVKAKTGFVNGVVALSGTARGADGRIRVFSIVANHLPGRHYSVRSTQNAVDALAATITGCR